MRLVSNAATSNVRVLSSGQTVRLATSQQGTGQVGQPISTTILRQQPTVLTTSATSGTTAGTVLTGTTTTSATIGGKQILLQKPISLSGQNVLQLVKTSQGMAVQTLPKVNVVQKAGTSIGGNIQQQLASGAQIVTASGAGNQGKTALIGTNVVKLMSPAAVSGNKILMKNSNLVQVGKMGTSAGKPAFVITNKQGQPIRTNQQIIFVTTAGGIRTVQTGSIVTSSASNFVSLVSSPQINTITSAMASGTNSVGTPSGTVKMIRGVGQQGKPITFTLPVSGIQGNKTGSSQLISVPQKALTIGGKAVTVQLASGNQKTVTIVSSAGTGGIQKTINAADLHSSGHKIVMMPSKRMTNLSNVITHKAIPVTTTQIDQSGATANSAGGQNNIIEGGHLEVLDQLDGAFDFSSSSDDESDSESIVVKNTNRKRKCGRSLGIAKGGISKKLQNKTPTNLKKSIPKYVKMGLFGGAPPSESESNENQNADEHIANANNEALPLEGAEIPDAITQDHQTNQDPNVSEAANIGNEEDAQMLLATTAAEASESSKYLNNKASTGDEYLQQDEQQTDIQQQQLLQTQQSGRPHTDPTPSETEAANILTTIKSGELLRNNDIKGDNNNSQTTIAVTTLSSPTLSTATDENVKILFNNEPAGKKNGAGQVKTTQKTTTALTTYTTTNTGHLDALASAALQASSGKFIYLKQTH